MPAYKQGRKGVAEPLPEELIRKIVKFRLQEVLFGK